MAGGAGLGGGRPRRRGALASAQEGTGIPLHIWIVDCAELVVLFYSLQVRPGREARWVASGARGEDTSGPPGGLGPSATPGAPS